MERQYALSMTKILSSFDKCGIEFLDDEGLRIRKQEARIYEGKAGYRQFLDHVYETLKNGGRIRQFNFGDLRYLTYVEKFGDEHSHGQT